MRTPNSNLLVLLCIGVLFALATPACDDDGGNANADAMMDSMGIDTNTSEDTSEPDTTMGQDTNAQDTAGGDTSSQDTAGGDTTGQDTASGDTTAQDTAGGDTTGQDTASGDTSGQDTETDVAGCTAEECAQNQQICDTTTGTCVDDTRCLTEGDPCDPTETHPFGFACTDLGNGDECVRTCSATDQCGSGEVCTLVTSNKAICQASECTGFDDTTSCASGEKCFWFTDNSAGVCVTAGAGQLGGSCEFEADCGAGLSCIGQECVPNDCDLTNPMCDTGESCVPNGIPDRGSCIATDCFPASDTPGCTSTETCTTVGRDASTGRLVGVCEASAALAEGTACTAGSGECAAGLACIGSVCTKLCDTDGSSPETFTCASGECGEVAPAAGLGACFECEVFGSLTCATGETCIGSARDGDGDLVGTCEPAGATAEGQTCTTAGDCDEGLLCRDGTCQALCDTAATTGFGVCTAGTCVPLNDGETELELGTCVPDGCLEPYTSMGCDTGNWCAPQLALEGTPLTGTCETAGSTAGGSACSGATLYGECEEQSACLGDGAGGAACAGICDPGAETGETGHTCPAGDACFALSDGTDDFNVGSCSPGCDLTAQDCAAGVGACVWAGLFNDYNASEDAAVCFNEVPDPTTCDTNGEFFICGELDLCLDIAGFTTGVECVELCRPSVGDFLTFGHPDCEDPAATCDPVFGPDSVVGVCN